MRWIYTLIRVLHPHQIRLILLRFTIATLRARGTWSFKIKENKLVSIPLIYVKCWHMRCLIEECDESIVFKFCNSITVFIEKKPKVHIFFVLYVKSLFIFGGKYILVSTGKKYINGLIEKDLNLTDVIDIDHYK